uniref:methyltransferase-like protein 27 isoform X2 n=1 Tax=Styela clava TaxID=7725 RepID=UPI0019395241|nr:methyltransferase-like protein 27 isoform X2 [Styela clava]
MDVTEAGSRVNMAMYANTPEEANEAYSKWADKYDEDLTWVLGSVAGDEVAENSMKYLKNTETALLLDLAASTGLVAEALLSRGYKGVMDAIELNEDMLKKAELKGIYRKHICFKISPDTLIPVEQGAYDTVTCGGAFGANHLEEGCIPNITRCLKHGGILIFNTRKTDANKKFIIKLNNVAEKLVRSGQLVEIEVKDMVFYRAKSKETGDVMKAVLYIYKKI